MTGHKTSDGVRGGRVGQRKRVVDEPGGEESVVLRL